MPSASSLLIPNRQSVLGGPFASRRSSLLFDIYPAQQQQNSVAVYPTRGSIKFTAASNQFLTRAGNLTNCNLFNFQNDGVTTKFSIAWWGKFTTIASGQTIFAKANPANFNGANSVWGLAMGGVGTRYDLYTSSGSGSNSAVSWTIGAGLTAGLMDFNVLTYDGGGGASKAKFYRNGSLVTTPDSTALPQLFQNNNNANCEFSIGRAISGALNYNGEMSQPMFFNGYVLTQTDVTNLYSSGAGTESDQLATVLGTNVGFLAGQYGFDEARGASRLDLSGRGNDLTDNGTCFTKLRIVDHIENGPNVLAIQGGGYPPSNAPTRSRRMEPWLNYNTFGPGLHGISLENGQTLYCATNIFKLMLTGHYFFAGRYDTALNTENYELGIGDDTQGVSPPGNDHSMYFGMLGPTNSGLSAGLMAAALRPDGTGEASPFGGVVTNLGVAGAGGAAAGATYPNLTDVHVRELSLVDQTNGQGSTPGGYRISFNGLVQPVWVDDGGDNDIPHRWLNDFDPNSLFFGTDTSGAGNSYTIGRVCMFGSTTATPPLSPRERAEVHRIMKASVGLAA